MCPKRIIVPIYFSLCSICWFKISISSLVNMQERFPLFFHAACFPFLLHLKQQHFTKQKLLPRIWIQYWKKSGYLHFFLFTFHVIALLFYILFALKIWRTWLNCFGCSFSYEPNEIVSGTTSLSSNLIPNNNDPRKMVVSIENIPTTDI